MAETLSWSQVLEIHRSWNGIATEAGRARSLLCNQGKDGPYPDRIEGPTLFYFVSPRTQAKEVHALRRALEEGRELRVFEKLGVNRWADHGLWRPVALREPESDGYRAFVLEQAGSAR